MLLCSACRSLEKLDFFKKIVIADDDFFMRPLDQIEDFSKQYKEKIGIPFGVAVSPNTYNSKKMRLLVYAGLRFIQMGVQTGSQRVLDDVFKRNTNVKKISITPKGAKSSLRI